MKSRLLFQIAVTCFAQATAFLAFEAVIPNSLQAQLGDKGSGEHIEGFKDTSMLPDGKWHQHDPDRPQPLVVTPGSTFSQGAPPPSDAEILFDGKDLSKWESDQGNEGAPAAWKVQDGYMEVTSPKGNHIRTRGKWSDFQLHVEWAAPTPPTGHGQARDNSGILINNMYEIQVLDSYNDKTYPDGQAGALYGQMPPLVNPSKPPGEWQTYDIIWESSRWNDKDKIVQKACVTVFLMELSCSIEQNLSAAQTESAAVFLTRDTRFTRDMPRRFSSNCKTTTAIRCATAISGFGSCLWLNDSNAY